MSCSEPAASWCRACRSAPAQACARERDACQWRIACRHQPGAAPRAIWRPRRSTRRSISTLASGRASRGREPRDERASRQHVERLSAAAAHARLRPRRAGRLLRRFVAHLDADRRRARHDRAWRCSGHWSQGGRASRVPCDPVHRGAGVRSLHVRDRPADRDSARRTAPRADRSWRPPFIYTDEDIAGVARSRPAGRSRQPLRAATKETLIGLLAASGLRVGEALRLDRVDINWSEGVLHDPPLEVQKSRLVPLAPEHRRGVGALRLTTRWTRARTRAARASSSRCAEPRRDLWCVWKDVPDGVRTAGVGAGGHVRRRIHALRHTFCCQHAARLVPRRRRRPAPPGVAVDLHRASGPRSSYWSCRRA